MLNVLGLCAGVGGLELGVHLAEPLSRVVCYVEIDGYPQRVLQQRIGDGYLDDAPVWDDLRTFDGREWRGVVDCIAAGFPCQPFSVDGRRRGADDERNLWPEVARVIREVGPGIVFLENVPAILPYYYHEILPSLQSMGFRTAEGIFSALEVGAPHRRERLFIMAHSDGRRVGDLLSGGTHGRDEARAESTQGGETMADAEGNGRSRPWDSWAGRTGLANGDGERVMGDAEGKRLQGHRAGRQQVPRAHDGSGISIGSGGLENAERKGRRTERTGRSGEAEGAESRGEYSRSGWWAVEPALGRVANGVPDRVGQLRALGNGVVPAVAAWAWTVLMEKLNA